MNVFFSCISTSKGLLEVGHFKIETEMSSANRRGSPMVACVAGSFVCRITAKHSNLTIHCLSPAATVNG